MSTNVLTVPKSIHHQDTLLRAVQKGKILSCQTCNTHIPVICLCRFPSRKQRNRQMRGDQHSSSTPHQKNGNISTGPHASLQYLTYYHNIVSAVRLACMPMWQLIASRQDSKAADLKLCSITGNRVWHCFEGQLLLHSNPNRSPPWGARSCWKAYHRELERLIVLSSPVDPYRPIKI